MGSIAARTFGAAVLFAAAASKAARPRESQEALTRLGAPWGVLGWSLVVIGELALAGGIAAGSAAASYAAAGLMLVFAAALVGQIIRGRAGLPCACFGPRSRIGWKAVVRNLLLAALYAGLPSVPALELSATGWLGVGLAVALVAVAALAVAILALAREVGELRLRVAPQSALEVPNEGPEIGSRVELDGRFGRGLDARVALAVFTSESCPVCTSLEPSIAYVAHDPFLAVGVFDEQRDCDVWGALDVPGSPYAVALGLDGTVLAKGTFNTLAQLESVVATAVRRSEEIARAG